MEATLSEKNYACLKMVDILNGLLLENKKSLSIEEEDELTDWEAVESDFPELKGIAKRMKSKIAKRKGIKSSESKQF